MSDVKHHPSCRPENDRTLIWKCGQCGLEEDASAMLEKISILSDAVLATDKYFKNLYEQWSRNEGRVVSESGHVLLGAEETERLCEIAGKLVLIAMQKGVDHADHSNNPKG